VVSGGFSGVRLVARGGSVLEETCDGFADIAAEMPWTRQTRSQIASISKQFAAAVTLILADQDAITLDDSVASVLPGCPGQWRDVSTRQLLTHTSGMNHWCALRGFDPAQPLVPGERLQQLLAAPLADPPGQVWRYSSPGYIILSAMLETAAHRPYAQLVHEHIIDRLSLSSTTVGRPGGSDAARGYRRGDPVAPWQLHTMPGTGDIWSSAGDLARFLTALHDGGLLPERVQPTLHDITVSQGCATNSTSRVTTSRYGLGHFHGTIDEQFAYLHPGDNPGYQSLAAWLPATRTLVVALSNDEDDDIEQTVADLVRQTAV
jgi:CubicO group peptidase (beta-lactamase class C family)